MLVNSRNKQIKDITNKKYNYLTAIRYIDSRTKSRIAYWLFRCDCGTEKIMSRRHVERNKITNCGCIKIKKQKNNTKRRVYLAYKQKCIEENILFSINEEEFFNLILQPCHYCKIPHSNFRKYVYKPNQSLDLKYNGVDRVDPKLGYTLFNCVPCCRICNRAKSDLPLEDFINWIKRVSDYVQK